MDNRDSKREEEEEGGGNMSKRVIIIVATSLLLISLTFGLCWLLMENKHKPARNVCLIRDTWRLPSLMSEMDQTKVATADFRTLARLNGFVKYTSSDKVDEYLPLKLHNLTHSWNSNGDSKLVFWTGCAKLTLNLASDTKQLIVGSIELNTANVNEHLRECQVTSTSIKLHDLSSSRYLCNTLARYECKSGFWHNNDTFLMKTVALLELHALEFEIDGSPRVLRTNQFSKKAEEC